uniref:Uncharacterized protein n=1 Tax=Parascaris univalens TaxID=6257 RepID=A0A914ZZ61_PARUN
MGIFRGEQLSHIPRYLEQYCNIPTTISYTNIINDSPFEKVERCCTAPYVLDMEIYCTASHYAITDCRGVYGCLAVADASVKTTTKLISRQPCLGKR